MTSHVRHSSNLLSLRFDLGPQAEELPMYEQIVRALAAAKITTERELQRVVNEHRRELQVRPQTSRFRTA